VARADESGVTTRNYDGTFSHWQGGKVEMLRIIHRVQDGAVRSASFQLDGSGRESFAVALTWPATSPTRKRSWWRDAR